MSSLQSRAYPRRCGAHLQSAHGYISYQGDVLPAAAVLQRLWERVFAQPDSQAHEELVGMYLNLPESRRNQDAAIDLYVADVVRVLAGEPLGEDAPTIARTSNGTPRLPVALPYSSVVAYQANLRASRSFLTIARALLRSPSRRLQELGSQAVMPYFQEQLRGRFTVSELRRVLGQVCADLDQSDLQIDLCRQLGQLGMDQAIVGACINQLQEDRLVV